MNNQPIKVLIVEDTKEHADLLEHILTNSSYPRFLPLVAATLREGVEKLKVGGVDLVLLDLSLPDSEASQTFRTVSELAPELAVVVVSGIADLGKAIELVQAGAQDYLIKGQVDSHSLLRSLQYAHERKRAQVALRQAHDQLEARVQERTAELLEANKRLQLEIAERLKAEEAALASNQKLTETLAELHTTQQALIHRERLSALGQMANGIAHEFNNVLTPIIGWTEHLLHQPEEKATHEGTRDTIQKIQSAANVGAAAVGRVREFARAEADAYGPVDLNDITTQSIAFTEPKWKHEAQAAGVTIDLHRQAAQIGNVIGESSQLRELLTHLITNAVRAIPRRGSITISTSESDDYGVLTVRDDGLGMNKVTRERCMDANLGSTHSSGRSTGFGAIHGILQRHNGKLDIQTEEGRGTKVSVFLPLATAAQSATSPPECPLPTSTTPTPSTPLPGPSTSHKNRILIAEDDSMVREVMFVYLSESGFDVTMAANGRLAVEEFTKSNGGFDLVITDRAMPELNGDQVALEIKRNKPSVPVILLTGFGDLMLSEGECPPGIDLVVGKPFTMASLRGALSKVGL